MRQRGELAGRDKYSADKVANIERPLHAPLWYDCSPQSLTVKVCDTASKLSLLSLLHCNGESCTCVAHLWLERVRKCARCCLDTQGCCLDSGFLDPYHQDSLNVRSDGQCVVQHPQNDASRERVDDGVQAHAGLLVGLGISEVTQGLNTLGADSISREGVQRVI